MTKARWRTPRRDAVRQREEGSDRASPSRPRNADFLPLPWFFFLRGRLPRGAMQSAGFSGGHRSSPAWLPKGWRVVASVRIMPNKEKTIRVVLLCRVSRCFPPPCFLQEKKKKEEKEAIVLFKYRLNPYLAGQNWFLLRGTENNDASYYLHSFGLRCFRMCSLRFYICSLLLSEVLYSVLQKKRNLKFQCHYIWWIRADLWKGIASLWFVAAQN